MKNLVYVLALMPLAALAGGSNYGIAPGARPDLAGKVSEWPVPTPRFARDPAVASNNVGIRKMVTDASGRLWYMGSHNDRLGVVE